MRAIVGIWGALKSLVVRFPLSQLAEGEIISALRPVEIGDVLGREPADLKWVGWRIFMQGNVLVTGAGGVLDLDYAGNWCVVECRD